MVNQNKISENSTEIKENLTWHKVDLSKKKVKHQPKPKWLRVKLPIGDKYTQLRNLVDKYNLHTICASGSCPKSTGRHKAGRRYPSRQNDNRSSCQMTARQWPTPC